MPFRVGGPRKRPGIPHNGGFHGDDPTGPGQQQRAEALYELLAERILVLDGATGTWLQGQDLTAEDFGGGELEGCNENLVLTRPDVILRMHGDYLAAGADMVETDTFGGTPLVLAEYGLADKALEINRRAAEIAREAAAAASTSSRLRFVAGSMGPTTKAMTVTGGVTFDELVVHYRTQALGLLQGGADVLLLETTQDTRNLKAGLIGIEQAFAEIGWRTPVMVSVTIEPMGTMLAGQGVDALYASVMHAPLLSVGINCATGPEFMRDHIRSLSAISKTLTSCYPNAGLPDVLASTRRRPSRSPASSATSCTKAGSTSWAAAAARRRRTSARSPRRPRARSRGGRRSTRKPCSRGSSSWKRTSTTGRSSWASARTCSGAGSSSASWPRGIATPRPRSPAPRSRTAPRSSTSVSRTPTATRPPTPRPS